ncbi:MAG: tetratricopeptide repeat protein [Bacteroidetes bacterium]|nr:tetratricopeptide repeat protein [Bacteroidota bacterium]
MKRITLTRVAMLAVALISVATMGFQCSSPNITSGKLYLQQYQQSKNQEKLDKALESFSKETQEKPNSAEGWYWLGHVYAEKKQYKNLQESWAKAQSLGGKVTEDINQYRIAYWGQAFNHGANTMKKAQLKKDKTLYGEAAEAFEAATKLQPDSSARYNAYVYLAYALMGVDRTDDALAPLQEQIKRNPTAEAYSAYGQLLTIEAGNLKKAGKEDESNKKYSEAIDLLNRATTDFPENGELNNDLLNTYIAANRVTEAVSKFTSYADRNTDDLTAQYAAGTALLQVSKFEDAAKYLERAIGIEPENTSALYNLSVAYLRWGISVRDNSENNNPDKPQADYKSIVNKAVPYIQTLLKLQADNATNWDLAGKIFATAGMTKEAGDAYKKADELRK